MPVLSEATIRAEVGNNRLIEGANTDLIRGSSYSCRAAKIFPGGVAEGEDEKAAIDWTTTESSDVFYRVQPRSLIWVRIRETVKLPPKVCAFWWQTNTLSRKGLMLVNMSMVDPGYEGPLACLFVNFGREPIDLDPGMGVARLVFHELDQAATPFPWSKNMPEYDREMRAVALQGPTSFLSLHEFSTGFQEEKERQLEDFRGKLEKKADDIFKERTENLPKFLLKSYAVAFGGLVLLTLATSFAPWIDERLSLDVDKKIEAIVGSEIGKRLQPISTIDAGTAEMLEERLEELENQIEELSEQAGD